MEIAFSDLVQLALTREQNSEAFYRRWAQRLEAPDNLWPRAKVLLLSLATEEARHQEILRKLKAIDLQPDGTDRTVELQVQDHPSPDDMPDGASTRDVIGAAIQREDRAVQFYADLTKLGGKLREVFGNLSQREKIHKQRLEDFCERHVLTWD